MSYLGKIIREVAGDRHFQIYKEKGRLIDEATYRKMKSRKTCEMCGMNFKKGEVPEVHHKVRRIDGGSNEEANLAAVHHGCHWSHHNSKYVG
ncbi:MAG: HNH endonuclease [Candidatus Blackburnbacteria bacterium]|nr:HNH endonuclease [Candidatus Blackburnbacteria bacterium]